MRKRVVDPDDLMPMIDQALLVLGGAMDTRSAAAVLAWIALHESDHLTATVQRGGGPARGLCQIEPKTYRDSMAQARKGPQTLAAVVRCHAALLGNSGGYNLSDFLEEDPLHKFLGTSTVPVQRWQFGVARIVLWEATSRPLPTLVAIKEGEHDLRKLFERDATEYWYRYWCRGCKGTPDKFRAAIRWGYEHGIDPLTYEPIAGRW